MAAEIIPLRREKVLLDTSIYISHLTRGYYADQIQDLIRSVVLYLHVIVFEELLVGARSTREHRELERLKKPFEKAGRLLVPSQTDWEETGHLLNGMVRQRTEPARRLVGITHDVLLSMTARRHGVRVITENAKDFEKIRARKNFHLTIWRQP